MSEDKEKPEKDKLNGLFILLFVTLMIWLISVFILPFVYPKIEERAQFGDSFGVINSLFSGLAFAGIIYTILLQRKELALQRDELKETRIELKRSATAQENSEKQQRRQSENLKITAKLNALNSLLNYHIEKEKQVPPLSREFNENRRTIGNYAEQIKEILNRKEQQ